MSKTIINVFHRCPNTHKEVVYELRVDIFEILLCRWCDWRCEIVVDDGRGNKKK